MKFTTRPGRMGTTQLEECDENGEYIRLVAEFFYDNEAKQVCDALNSGSVKFSPLQKMGVRENGYSFEEVGKSE